MLQFPDRIDVCYLNELASLGQYPRIEAVAIKILGLDRLGFFIAKQ